MGLGGGLLADHPMSSTGATANGWPPRANSRIGMIALRATSQGASAPSIAAV